MDDSLYYFSARRPFYKEVFSLQTIVMRVITTNFERYMREYESPDSRIPKYYFEFLQKKYSQDLFLNLLEYGILKQEFLDFVLNIHLKEICLKTVPNQCNIETIKEKIIEIGNGLAQLSLMGAVNFHHIKPVLSHLPNVRKLELEYSNCDDDAVKVIAENCPLLTELNVYATLVGDEGMKYLCFPEKHHKLHLEALTVSRTHVKDNGVLMILKNMPSIKILTHENLSRIISNAAAKNEFPKNCILYLTYVEVHNAKTELKVIAQLCPSVKHLFVKSINSQEQLSNCCEFRKLEEVCLSYESGKHPSLCIDSFLKTCGFCITSLSLDNFIISVDVLIQSCPHLRFLELCDPAFEDVSRTNEFNYILEKLIHFKIYGCSLLSDDEVKAPSFIIQSSPNLESMSLQCCFIGPQIEDVILKCPSKLMQLDFTESLVSIDFLQKILFKHKDLQCLIIENSGLHSSDFRSLFTLINHLNHPVNMLWC